VRWVAADLERRLAWASDPQKRETWADALHALTSDSQRAEPYAALVLYNEHLPREERKRQQHEKAKTYVFQAMQGKPATEKQHGLLRRLGYAGELPEDRADASALIDRLMRQQGGR
jgi:hypothetical protein